MPHEQDRSHRIDRHRPHQPVVFQFVQPLFRAMAIERQGPCGVNHQVKRPLQAHGQIGQTGWIAEIPGHRLTSGDGHDLLAAQICTQLPHESLPMLPLAPITKAL